MLNWRKDKQKKRKKKKILDKREKTDIIEAWGASSVPLVISGDKNERVERTGRVSGFSTHYRTIRVGANNVDVLFG